VFRGSFKAPISASNQIAALLLAQAPCQGRPANSYAGRPAFSEQVMDDLAIIVGGTSLSGWSEIHVTRGAERVPSAFDVTATEKAPGQFRDVWIEAGAPVTVKIGGDLVLTGYVDRVIRQISPTGHIVRVQGRSKMQDIVDCSVTGDVLTGMSTFVADLLTLATQICKPYGISVKSLTGDKVPVGKTAIPFSAALSETGSEVIETVARYTQVLAYDDVDGNLVLAQAGGGGTMASGFAEGVNVQNAACSLSMDQRYSEYLPVFMSYQMFGQGSIPALGKVLDKTVPRFRQLMVISEQFNSDGSLAEKRARWEMARRYGRSQAVRLTCDSWRDSAGKLWQPNAYASLHLPSLKAAPKDPWVIGDVTYNRDAERGTTAELALMPRGAFTPQPQFLYPFAVGVGDDAVPPAGAAR